jgi:hypothetical protein
MDNDSTTEQRCPSSDNDEGPLMTDTTPNQVTFQSHGDAVVGRYWGESGGEPRCYEDPFATIEVAQAAFQYLDELPEVDSKRLAMLGICLASKDLCGRLNPALGIGAASEGTVCAVPISAAPLQPQETPAQ